MLLAQLLGGGQLSGNGYQLLSYFGHPGKKQKSTLRQRKMSHRKCITSSVNIDTWREATLSWGSAKFKRSGEPRI